MEYEVMDRAELSVEDRMKLDKFERVVDLVEQTNGRIFGAKVVRKKGGVRSFNAHLHEKSFDRLDSGIIDIYDMTQARKGRNPYRSINIDGVLELHINGDTYEFEENV